MQEQNIVKDKLPQNDNPNWLTRLQRKWKVKNIVQVVLILCTFAIGGSASGYLARKVLHGLLGIESKTVFWALYIPVMTVLWPLCVLVVSIPFGQFSFFKKYLSKMGRRIIGKK